MLASAAVRGLNLAHSQAVHDAIQTILGCPVFDSILQAAPMGINALAKQNMAGHKAGWGLPTSGGLFWKPRRRALC